MTHNRLLVAVTIAATTVLLAACGSHDNTAAIKAGVAKGMMNEFNKDKGPFAFTQAAADCTAAKIVDTIGADKVAQLGLNTQGDFKSHPLSATDASTMANAIVNCAPNDSVITYFVSQFDRGVGSVATAGEKACMHARIGRQAWIDMLAAEYDGQAVSAEQKLRTTAAAAAKACIKR